MKKITLREFIDQFLDTPEREWVWWVFFIFIALI